MYLSFAVHKLANFQSNPGKVKFEGLVNILKCIIYNNTLGLKYYYDMNYAPLSDILRQAGIKNENQLMDFIDSSWKYCPDNGRSTGAYIIFYQGVPINYGTYVPVPVDQSSAESEYNALCTAGMSLTHSMMLIN